MAFVRVQGKQIKIMRSKRVDGKVRQERLHAFPSAAEAAGAIDSQENWVLLCDSLENSFSMRLSKAKRQVLKTQVKKALDSFSIELPGEELSNSAHSLMRVLDSFQEPFTPMQAKQLKNAENTLNNLLVMLHEKLDLLEETQEDNMHGFDETLPEKQLEQGLDAYELGEWNRAKTYFHKGLAIDPEHVDLHVHAGLIELMENHYDLALAHFDQAIGYGKPIANQLLAELEAGDELTSDWESRPFLRALANKSITLMRMKRYEDAIKNIELHRMYNTFVGSRNLIGECYLALGNYEQADLWFDELFWPEAFYTKALILFTAGHLAEAITLLLRGITQNWEMAQLFTYRAKPLRQRYMVDGSAPMEIEASEFFHNHGATFIKNTRFINLIKTILDDEQVAATIATLENSITRRREDPKFTIPKAHFSLLFNGGSPAWASKHQERIFVEYYNPYNPYWTPENNEIICGVVSKKLKTNWRMTLTSHPQKTFYFRPKVGASASVGKQLKICVGKAWLHRRRLCVSGRVER